MSCEKYLNLLDDLVEDELDQYSVGEVNLHLFACCECAARFEILKKEKAMYAHHLFEIEPPADFWKSFQAKMKPQPIGVSQTIKTSPVVFGWTKRITGFLRLYPAFSAVFLLAAFGLGFGFLKYVSSKTTAGNEYAAEINRADIQTPSTKSTEINEIGAKNFPTKEAREESIVSKSIEKNKVNKFLSVRKTEGYIVKTIPVEIEKIKNHTIRAIGKSHLPGKAQETEERLHYLQLRNLETETAEQIEKIEMLLRAFRNTRSVEGGETFDVAYEKQLAGKLLEKNIRLRRGAENFGTLHTEEILGKVEPFLLDISNLENNPAPEKIFDIKERVKNQNIIASLQIY